MTINRHFIKTSPTYQVNGDKVKLLKVLKTNQGLVFTAEILDGNDKGKWTTVNKKDLKLIKGE